MNQQNKTERWVGEFEAIAVDVEGCQKGGKDCGKKNGSGEFICPTCKRWGGMQVEPKYFKRPITTSTNIRKFIKQLLSDARREERERCLEALENSVGSGLKLDPLSFVHIGGRKDIYEVALMGKVGDNPMVIPYNLFRVAVEKVVSEQITKALTTAEESIKKIK